VADFIGFDSSFEKAEIVLFGAPFDGTVSFRPGARFAPEAIRKDSWGLETYSPYLDEDLQSYELHDAGDLDLPFGNTARVLNMIENYVDGIVKDGKIPLMMGGEHLVTYPAVKAVCKRHEDLCIIHFDAHADLRTDYMEEYLSHATVMRRVWESVGDERIFQYGIRSGLREEFQWAKEHTFLRMFALESIQDDLKIIGDKPVYVTIDMDVLDPSVFPGTGTPEPGGISFKELLDALRLIRHLNVVGADVVELSPHYDSSGISTAAACKTIREMVLAIVEKK
jgi:agmatinase